MTGQQAAVAIRAPQTREADRLVRGVYTGPVFAVATKPETDASVQTAAHEASP